MMKFFNTLLALIAAALSISCVNEREAAGSAKVVTSLELSATECTLSQNNSVDEALTISWSGVDGNPSAKTTLTITMEGNDNVWSRYFTGGETSYTMSSAELNSLVVDSFRYLEEGAATLKVKVNVIASKSWKISEDIDSAYVNVKAYIPVYPEHNHKAPRYWSPYEYNFVTNKSMPEAEWKKNIDWVADNLKNYGYTMVSTDGWMNETDAYDEDGYLDRHQTNWEHDYGYWAEYLESKGMILGVYANPLWIPSGAASAGIKIKGTDIPIEDIIDRGEYRNMHGFLWAQIDRPGAEEWVRGYVDHYAEMGVKFLRVDFMSWYEDGYDKGFGTVGPDRPDWMYPTALRWIREQCDKHGMIFSLVMPHLYNDAATEKNYAHMIRIGNDTGDGGWYMFSDRDKGIHYQHWSQYANPFDGFIYFSRVSGRGKVMLDGDFLRLNTFASDDERRSVVTICVMSGGPVTVSDQYNTAGSYIKFYQNRELLALMDDGFVGKPKSNDPLNDDSLIWSGEMSNGDVIVAVFNRDRSARNVTVDMSSLCTFTPKKVRDIWEHKEVAVKDSYSLSVPAHGCVVYRLVK